MTEHDEPNGWSEYRRLVLKSLEDLFRLYETHARDVAESFRNLEREYAEKLKEVEERLRDVEGALKVLKAQSAMIGFVTGVIVSAVVSVIVVYLTK